MITSQYRDGFAPEIAESGRFFGLNSFSKTDTPTGWNTPANWQELNEIPDNQPVGFAGCGHGSTFAVIDYDHVIDTSGRMYARAWDLYKRIEALGGTYTEWSVSETGIHQIIDLGEFADSFLPETNSPSQLILWMDPDAYNKMPKAQQRQVPKVELFLETNGRFVLLTGRKFKKERRVATGESAANIWYELLAERERNHDKYGSAKGAKTSGSDRPRIPTDESTLKRVVAAMDYISANDYTTWIKVGQACYNIGIDFEVWDTWSQFTDKRAGVLCDKYKPKEMPYKWQSFGRTASMWNAGTIYNLAKENGWTFKADSLEPDDLSDLGQATMLKREYGNCIRFAKATGFLTYDSKVWREDDLRAQLLAQQLTDRQMQEAKSRIRQARDKYDVAVESGDKDEISGCKARLKAEESFRKYVLERRSSQRIAASLKELQPKVALDVTELDADGLLLNTPGGTIDLRTGTLRPHHMSDYCTKMTSVTPSDEGMEIFEDFLDKITCQDTDLKRYLQEVMGLCAIGEVKREELLLVTGSGGNGKSTFFNLIAEVLGDYAGSLSSDVLTTGNRRNKSPEYATLRGRRFVIAAELEEGSRLDAGVVKRLCSTDPVRAEPKYKQPFEFKPSHHLVLYTNFLPKVGSNDDGTWDRLVAIPFNARFRGQAGEVKDYKSYLYEHCGDAVLTWIIEGARRVIENGFFIEQPQCVKDAIAEYREENDWLSAFITDRCYTDPTYTVGAGELYTQYREYCTSAGEFCRRNSEFANALEKQGYEGRKTKTGKIYRGLRLKNYSEKMRDSIAAQRA